MRFETQTNLYDQQPLITKLTSHDTRFDVVQGEINALISESEMTELVNGGSTMYSAMNDIKVDVTGLHADLSSLETTVDGNTGQITTLNSKQAQYEASLETLSATLSDTNADLYGADGTIGVINRVTAVEATASGLTSSVTSISNNLQTNYYTKSAVDNIASGIGTDAANALTSAVNGLQTQIDGKIETWYGDVVPTTSNYPASGWTTTTLKEQHLGDLYYDTKGGYAYQYIKTGSTYSWNLITTSGINDALTLAGNKKRIFVAEPTTPYEVGDLWVQGASGDIMCCNTAKASGAYNSAHWEKASKYTDDSVFTTFKNGQYAQDITAIGAQIDEKVEVHYGTAVPTLSNAPANSWTAEQRVEHLDDLFYNTSTGYCYRFIRSGSSFTWSRIKDSDITSAASVASNAQSIANGKATIFTGANTPSSPQAGDLWLKSANDDILTYVNSQWQKYNKYTDDSALTAFRTGQYAQDITAIGAQIDNKVEVHYGTVVPTLDNAPASSWSADERAEHVDDLYYNTSTGYCYRFTVSGSTYSWTRIKDSDITSAATAASTAQSIANGKATIFTGSTTPALPSAGDLWLKSTSDDILTYVNGEWIKYNKYTDDTTANSIATNLANNYSTTIQTQSLINQAADGITLEVSQKYEANNFIYDGELTEELGDLIVTGCEPTFTTIGSKQCMYLNKPSNSSCEICFPISSAFEGKDKTKIDRFYAQANDLLTVSMEVYVTSLSVAPYIYVYKWSSGQGVSSLYKKSDNVTGSIGSSATVRIPTNFTANTWQRIWFTAKIDSSETNTSLGIRFYAGSNTVNLYIRHVKLEYGEFSTNWSPATEDTDANITGNEIVSRINQTATSISIEASKINLNGYTTINGNFSIDEDGKLTIVSSQEGSEALVEISGDYIRTRRSDGIWGFNISGKTMWANAYDVDDLRIGAISSVRIVNDSNSRGFGIYAVEDFTYDESQGQDEESAIEYVPSGGLSLGIAKTTRKKGDLSPTSLSGQAFITINRLDNDAIGIYKPIITTTDFINGEKLRQIKIGPSGSYGPFISFQFRSNTNDSYSEYSYIRDKGTGLSRFILDSEFLIQTSRSATTASWIQRTELCPGYMYLYNSSRSNRVYIDHQQVTLQYYDSSSSSWKPKATMSPDVFMLYGTSNNIRIMADDTYAMRYMEGTSTKKVVRWENP